MTKEEVKKLSQDYIDEAYDNLLKVTSPNKKILTAICQINFDGGVWLFGIPFQSRKRNTLIKKVKYFFEKHPVDNYITINSGCQNWLHDYKLIDWMYKNRIVKLIENIKVNKENENRKIL